MKKPQPKLLIDVQQDGKPRLWLDCELLQTYTKNCYWMSKPLETLMVVEAALIACGIFPKVETPEDT